MSIRADIIDALVTACETTMLGDYDLNPVTVSRFDVNIESIPSHDLPMLMIHDPGVDRRVSEDSTHVMYIMEINLYGLVTADTNEGLHDQVNKMDSTITALLYSDPSLGSNAPKLQYVTMDRHLYQPTKLKPIAMTRHRAEIVYWVEIGSE